MRDIKNQRFIIFTKIVRIILFMRIFSECYDIQALNSLMKNEVNSFLDARSHAFMQD